MLIVEYFHRGREETEEFYRFLSEERFQSWVEQLDLPLQLVEQKISIGANVNSTVSEAIAAIVYHCTKSVDVHLRRMKSANQAVICTTGDAGNSANEVT